MVQGGDGGIGIVIKKGLCKFIYSGVIFTDNEGDLSGEMFDCFGISRLFSIRMTSEKIAFIKKYEKRNDTIEYSFERDGDLWVGKYSGSSVGEGGAKCVIREVSDNFFLPLE